ncbi:hypothetical protein HanPI659440_Chr14g0569301 [Helianthus annuus]|nr:hypothetical protein HanPI659440_Chr14g0569301 [Helianthus annuus]
MCALIIEFHNIILGFGVALNTNRARLIFLNKEYDSMRWVLMEVSCVKPEVINWVWV